jgi:hypothetical protein
MGTTLNGTTPQNTYPSLIKVGDNGAVDATLQRLSDGEGNDLPLEVSSTAVNFTGTVTQNGNPISTPPSGVAGAIQFSDGSAFSSDATNLFWDNINKRLGVGFDTPTASLQVRGSGSTSATTALLVQNSAGASSLRVSDDNNVFITKTGAGATLNISNGGNFGLSIFGFQNSPVIGANVSIAFGRYTTSATQGALTTTTLFLDVANSRVAIGNTSPSASSILDVSSTTQGFLPPRMTTTQKNAISSPASGLQVYDTTLNQMSYYNGSSWINF